MQTLRMSLFVQACSKGLCAPSVSLLLPLTEYCMHLPARGRRGLSLYLGATGLAKKDAGPFLQRHTWVFQDKQVACSQSLIETSPGHLASSRRARLFWKPLRILSVPPCACHPLSFPPSFPLLCFSNSRHL